jgi:flagellin
MPIALTSTATMLQIVDERSPTRSALDKSYRTLSTGCPSRVSADPMQLAITQRAKQQMRASTAAEQRANEGLLMAQTADEALAQMQGVLARMRELAAQSCDGGSTRAAREQADAQYTTLKAELQRVQGEARYGTTDLLGTRPDTATFHPGPNETGLASVTLELGGIDLSGLATSSVAGADTSSAEQALSALRSVDALVSDKRVHFSERIDQLETAVDGIKTVRLNFTAASSRVRDADVAAEMASLTASQILRQPGVAVAAQAGPLPQLTLNLL